MAERDEDAEKERKARLLALEKKNELDLSQLKIELAQKIGEEEKKQRDKGRELAGGFFDAAISRQIPQFAKNYALNIGKTIFQNGSQDIFAAAKIQLPGQGTISNPTGLGKLLQGTPFGLDPLKGAMDLSVATINLNTAAIKELTESVTSRVSFADGGTPGGTTSGFPSVFGLGLDPSLGGFAGNDLSSGFSFLGGAQPSAVADIAKLASAVGGASAIKSVGGGIGSLDSIFSKIPALSAGGIQTGPGTATTYAGLASAGVQAGAGVLGLINGLNTGGAKGRLAGSWWSSSDRRLHSAVDFEQASSRRSNRSSGRRSVGVSLNFPWRPQTESTKGNFKAAPGLINSIRPNRSIFPKERTADSRITAGTATFALRHFAISFSFRAILPV